MYRFMSIAAITGIRVSEHARILIAELKQVVMVVSKG
jgi:hypothetical protein